MCKKANIQETVGNLRDQADLILQAQQEMTDLLNCRHHLSVYQRDLDQILDKSGNHRNRFEVVSFLVLKNFDAIKKQLVQFKKMVNRDRQSSIPSIPEK